MRLFAAIVPPKVALDHLGAAVPTEGDRSLRWAARDSWHITLAFYGDVADGRVTDLVERLHRVGRRHPPADVALTGAGQFGRRVLWVGCTGQTDALRRLAQSCAAAGRRVGAAGGQQRRFRAHVTLARSPRPADLRPHVAALRDYAGPEWTARTVTLVRSHLGAGAGARPRYEAMATVDLAG